MEQEVEKIPWDFDLWEKDFDWASCEACLKSEHTITLNRVEFNWLIHILLNKNAKHFSKNLELVLKSDVPLLEMSAKDLTDRLEDEGRATAEIAKDMPLPLYANKG